MTTENKNAGVVWRPQPRQMEFMRRPEPEALYGGAAGGGYAQVVPMEDINLHAAAGAHSALPGADPAQDLPAAF